jgi:hypothetical protein
MPPISVLPLVIQLSIVAVEAEHSRDASSRTTTISVAKHELVVRTERGGHGRRPSPEPKKRTLTGADEEKVRDLVEESRLLGAKDVDVPLAGPGRDYTFEMKVTLDGRTRSLRLHGPISDWGAEAGKGAPAFATSAEYQAAVKLVQRLEELAER